MTVGWWMERIASQSTISLSTHPRARRLSAADAALRTSTTITATITSIPPSPSPSLPLLL
jgi:hypothetical protein